MWWSRPDSPTLKQQLENSNNFSKTAFTKPYSLNVVVDIDIESALEKVVAMMGSSQSTECIAICCIW